MAWVKLDDRFATHPKVLGISDTSLRLYLEMLCYVAAQGTDGRIPPPLLRGRDELVSELLAAGLWDREEDGLIVHDFLDYNPSREERDARSDAARKASRMRWASESNSEPQSENDASTTRGRGGVGSEIEGLKSKECFAEFWDIYPRKVGKRAARAAFDKALKRAPAEVIIAGARRYEGDPNRSGEFTAHPTTWLNRDGWEDESLPSRDLRRPDPALRRLRQAADLDRLEVGNEEGRRGSDRGALGSGLE